jgi:hypothetical protein
MTDTPTPAPGTPRELLATTRELTRRVRLAQRGAWFPLLVFALVTLAATPFDRYGHRVIVACAPVARDRVVCSAYSPLAFFYWPVALVAAYVAITGFYLYRSRRLGVGTRVRPYVIAGIVLALLLSALALWAAHNPVSGWQSSIPGLHRPLMSVPYQLRVPTAAIGLGLLVLARVERSWALLGFTVAYLVAGLAAGYAAGNFGRVMASRPSPWAFLPCVIIPGGVLLLGSLGFWLAQRPAAPRPAGRPAP